MNYKEARQEVYDTVMRAKDAGLIRLSSGNISVRTENNHVAITPSGIKYDVLKPEDISIVDINGNVVDSLHKPSSETAMHTAVLRAMPEINAVCHTHSPFAITFSSLDEEIPPISLELFGCGAPIPVASWACPGTPEGGEIAVAAFKSRPSLKVCLLRNHGLVAIGSDLYNAFEMAYDAEIGMQIFYQARSMGKPGVISEAQAEQIRIAYA